MKSNYLSRKIGRILLALTFLMGVGMASSLSVQAQYPYPDYRRDQNRDRDYRRDQDRDRDYRRDQDRDYRRDRDNRRNDQYGRNGGYGNNGYYQAAMNQGYQDGLYTGSNDAQRRQNYNPQRSHFYRNGGGSYGGYGNNGRYGGNQSQQAYRDGFLRGYDEGFRRYGGNNRRRNGNYGRWPLPW